MYSLETKSPPKYGVTEYKKRTLDSLTLQVANANGEVSQLQSIVDSLTGKLATYNGYLSQADANKTQAHSNLSLIDTVVKNALNLNNSSKITLNEILLAEAKTEAVAQKTASVINKLIYTADMINKLANLITRKKSQNPLISDQLVSMIATAETNANNAVALTLVALDATFIAQATNKEVKTSGALENLRSEKLFNKLTVDTKTGSDNLAIQTLLTNAYKCSLLEFDRIQGAYNRTLKELNLKTAELNKAQINLNSLESGLAAANAAALAS